MHVSSVYSGTQERSALGTWW